MKKTALAFFSVSLMASAIVFWGLGTELGVFGLGLTTALLFLFCLFLLSFLLFKPDLFILSLPYLISFLWVSCSLLYIENGGWIQEQLQYGEESGATGRYIALAFVFIVSSFPSFYFFSGVLFKEKYTNKIEGKIIVVSLMFFAVISLVVPLALYGVPIFDGVNRFDYRASLPGWMQRIFPLIYIFSFCCGWFYHKARSFFYVCILFLIAFILFLHGEKFTFLFWSIIFFVIGYCVSSYIKSGDLNLRKFIFLGVIAFLVLLGNVLWNYHVIHNLPIERLFGQILDRAFGLQGHVWFGIDKIYSEKGIFMHPEDSFFPYHKEDKPSGLIALMYEISPYEMVRAYRERGIRFTMGAPAVALAHFGFLGAIAFQMLGGLFVGMVASAVKAAVKMDMDLWVLPLLIGYHVGIQSFMMGDPFYLYEPVGVLFFIVLLSFFIFVGKRIRFK